MKLVRLPPFPRQPGYVGGQAGCPEHGVPGWHMGSAPFVCKNCPTQPSVTRESPAR